MKTIKELAQERAAMLETIEQNFATAVSVADELGETVAEESQKAFDDGMLKIDAIDTQVASLNKLQAKKNATQEIVNPIHSSERKVAGNISPMPDMEEDKQFAIPRSDVSLQAFESDKDAYVCGKWIQANHSNDHGVRNAAQAWLNGHEKVAVTLTGDTATDGQELVPTPLLNAIIAVRNETGVGRKYVTMHPMASNTLALPKETTLTTAALISGGEGGTIAGTDPQFSSDTLTAAPWGSLVTISNELLNNSAVNLSEYLAGAFGHAFGVAEDSQIFNDGTNGIADGTNLLASAVITTAVPLDLWSEVTMAHFESMVGNVTQVGRDKAWYINPQVYHATMYRLQVALAQNNIADIGNGVQHVFLGFPVRFVEEMSATDVAGDPVCLFGTLSESTHMGVNGGFKIDSDSSVGFATNTTVFRAIQNFGVAHTRVGSSTAGNVDSPMSVLKTGAAA